MPIQTESAGSHSQKMRFAKIPALFYLIISGCHSGRHNPLLFAFTGNNISIAGTSSHEMGFWHPYPKLKYITNKGENKIRCMRVLFNFQCSQLFQACNYLNPEETIFRVPKCTIYS